MPDKEQSTSVTEGSLTLDNASVQRLLDYGILHFGDHGWYVARPTPDLGKDATEVESPAATLNATASSFNLGDDEELCERLRNTVAILNANAHKFADMVRYSNVKTRAVRTAAARIEALLAERERLPDKIAAAIQQARDEIGANEQQRIAFAYAEAAMRAALSVEAPESTPK
jgi:hypothetical protein